MGHVCCLIEGLRFEAGPLFVSGCPVSVHPAVHGYLE